MRISDWSSTCALPIFQPVDNACPDQRLAAGPGEAGAGQQVVQYGARRFCSLGASGLRDLHPIGACFRLIALIGVGDGHGDRIRSEEHTSELQSLMRISYAVFCLKKKNNK